MHPIVLFVIIFFGVLFVIGLFIATWFISKSRVKNKPENALLLVKNGQEILPFKARQDGKPSNKATKYNYGQEKHVLVPNKYEPIYVKNRRLLFMNNIGQIIASPFNDKEKLSQSEREKLIYEFVESKVGADVIREIKGKSTINVIFIAVVAFAVGIACVFLFNFVKANYMDKQTEQTETEQPIITEQYVPITEDN